MSEINVTLFEHPAGSLMRIEIDGRILVLDSEQALALVEAIEAKLPEMPVKLKP